MATNSLILAALCAILATPAIAGPPLLPPTEYDHKYDGQVVLVQMPQRDIYQTCGGPRNVNGCAEIRNDACHIWMVSHRTVRVRNLHHLYRHERAHCNGWPGHHPD